jgi:uncharacterized membrane protein
MNTDLIYNILQIVFTIAAVTLIFIGLRYAIKKLDKDAKEKEIPRTVIIKSTKIILLGICFYGLARYAANTLSTAGEGYGMLDIMIQSLWEAVYRLGFVAFLPYIINRIRGPKRKEIED